VTKTLIRSNAALTVTCLLFAYLFIATTAQSIDAGDDVLAKVGFLFTEAIQGSRTCATVSLSPRLVLPPATGSHGEACAGSRHAAASLAEHWPRPPSTSCLAILPPCNTSPSALNPPALPTPALHPNLSTSHFTPSDPVKMAAMSEGPRGPGYAAQDWAHLCTWDLFVGQWIYLQGLEKRVFTAHSLLLAFSTGAPHLALLRAVVRGGACSQHA